MCIAGPGRRECSDFDSCQQFTAVPEERKVELGAFEPCPIRKWSFRMCLYQQLKWTCSLFATPKERYWQIIEEEIADAGGVDELYHFFGRRAVVPNGIRPLPTTGMGGRVVNVSRGLYCSICPTQALTWIHRGNS